jgi:hypothetical protein
MNNGFIYVQQVPEPGMFSLFLDLLLAMYVHLVSFVGVFGTILSVVIAVFLYYLKVKSDKRDAARVLLMEIRNAERTISAIDSVKKVAETTLVMPVASWHKFQHLFVSDLDSDELTLINNFYNLCTLIQAHIDRINAQIPISNEEKIRVAQHLLGKLAWKYSGNKESYDLNKDLIISKLNGEVWWFSPDFPTMKLFSEYLPAVKFVSTTTCGEKLKKIAKIS